jgi:signal transduction histidine kinase
MADELHVQELTTLKTIAETLNQSNDLIYMLDAVLERLLEVTGLSFGWIFLAGKNNEYECAADRNLPPGLLHKEKQLMQCGSCWCLDRYYDGRLKNAVNILSCKRLEIAKAENSGDTCGFTHHATVPLRIGERKFGLLNVGAPGKEHFTNEELALLQAVAFQIGVAVERMRLHEAEQRRAELFARLGEFSRSLTAALSGEDNRSQLPERALQLIGTYFDWPLLALAERSGQDFAVRIIRSGDQVPPSNIRFPITQADWINQAARMHGYQEADAASISVLSKEPELFPPILSAMAAPVTFGGNAASDVLLIGHHKSDGLNQADGAVLEAIAEHMAIALENARLEENRRELARLEERNRLARDLHDSVSQMLFSISMTAKGVESFLEDNHLDTAKIAVKDMQTLSREALKEMRSLIMQLRPAGVEKGILTALIEYGTRLGLQVNGQAEGILALTGTVEETLWRIGQEALNNVSKHAGSKKVDLTLSVSSNDIVLSISDTGRGMAKKEKSAKQGSLGLSIMQERAEALGGRFRLTSMPRKGTTIEVIIPLYSDSEGRPGEK